MTFEQNIPAKKSAQDAAWDELIAREIREAASKGRLASVASQTDAAWDELMSRPEVIEENECIAREVREAASKGGLGSDPGQADPA
jgi:hypothetical protein